MPPAILATVGLGLAGMVDQNVQNKTVARNAENATKSAQEGVAKNQASAQGGLSNYLAANPGVAGPGSFNPAASSNAIPLAGGPPQAGAQAPNAGPPGLAHLPPQVQQILASIAKSQGGQVA